MFNFPLMKSNFCANKKKFFFEKIHDLHFLLVLLIQKQTFSSNLENTIAAEKEKNVDLTKRKRKTLSEFNALDLTWQNKLKKENKLYKI